MLFVLVALLFQSCYKEDDINADLGTPHYQLPQSDHALDIALNKFKDEVKSNVLYAYKPVDYKWNLTRNLDVEFIKQANKNDVLESWNSIQGLWLNYYSIEFIKEYIPYKIILSDTLKQFKSDGKIQIHNTFSGLNYMAFGKVNSDYKLMDNDSKNIIKGEYHGEFFGNYLYKYERIKIIENFFKVTTDEFYEANLQQFRTEQEIKDRVEKDPKEYGFWEQKDDGFSYTVMSPSKIEDVTCFIKMITSHTKEELELLMVGYPKIQSKYNIIIQDIKDNFNLDLQSIGNDK
jgi:hypothetical protein